MLPKDLLNACNIKPAVDPDLVVRDVLGHPVGVWMGQILATKPSSKALPLGAVHHGAPTSTTHYR